DDYTASLGLSWEVDIWGKVKREKEEALARLLQTEEIRKAVQIGLVAQVATGYYTLLMLDEQLEIARQSLNLSDSTLLIAQTQYEFGEATMLAITQAKAQRDVARQLIPQIELSIFQQENALALLCGHYPETVPREPGQESFAPVPASGYPVSSLANRPDVLAAELELRAANARVGISQASMYPSLSINASGGLNAYQAANLFAVPGGVFSSVAAGLVQPVFQRRRLRTQYEQARIEREKAELSFRQLVLQGYMEVSDALARIQKVEEQAIASASRQAALQEGIETSNILFQNGMASYLEVIVAQSTYLQARLENAQLARDKAAATIELYRALGGGWN
ncbi:TolC family protein, partial [Pontibacter sp. 13R65]